MTKDEIIETIIYLIENKTKLDTTIPWLSDIRESVYLTTPICIKKINDNTLEAVWGDTITIIVRSDPEQIELKSRKHPDIHITMVPPFEWGALAGLLITDWENLPPEEKDQEKEKQQISLFPTD